MATCIWKPALMARLRSSGRANAVSAIAGMPPPDWLGIPVSGIDRLLPGAPTNIFLVRFAGASRSTTSGAALERAIAPIPAHFEARPQDLVELSQGGGLLTTLVVLLAILGFAAHILFSPWLLLVVLGILLWIKFGPRHPRQ